MRVRYPRDVRGSSTSLLLLSLLTCAAASACSDEDSGPGRGSGVLGAPVDGGGGSGGDAASGGARDAGSEGGQAPDAALGPEESGEATYYDADGTGACGFSASNDFMVAAINDEQYSKENCGRCVSVTGPRGTVTVRIVDKCPGCDEGDLDLSQTAFGKIAKLSDGRVPITWRFVACP